ncbi:hypothetical protein CspHIS471_0701040 [Cutaneotrichosporon sp. HIS471]|nr:hypothetical protein CspHIS471_0701040 [Cutaneotrichosporon sp. HIS471]
MGVPKFFRWISERYPLTSQLITPNSIPTFDNLYLDMNGIIHNCSHPPSSEDDPHFRITEEQMVLAIFQYIDFLFTKIKPQKVFFMAIDGVAPRAKMNQQRSRRFRTARDAREQREAAERKGEKLPEEKAFDSNCITPGTPFMARLSDHLKYYVRKRMSEDAEWRGVQVILSGHDVPGEGEHKIQEYIRTSKAQPGYNPNTRHCLYGLDADLVMLGLLSHDPHFCLLREEVTFGRKVKKNQTLQNSNMFLLHLSLVREYLDLEFASVAAQISFKYDLERIIDDWILMGFFVGNDFLPHLPGLHINEGALEYIWKVYKEVLPVAGGYINEHGTINLPRLQLLLDKLTDYERDTFAEQFANESWYKGKQEKDVAALEKARKRGKLIITKSQKKLLDKVKTFVKKHQSHPTAEDRFTLVNELDERDRSFVQSLADDLHLRCTWDEVDDYGQPLIVLSFNVDALSEPGEGDEVDEEWESDEDTESAMAIQRMLDKFAKAKIVDDDLEDAGQSFEEKMDEKIAEWKRGYYKEKLNINWDDPESLHPILYRYVEGLQWVVSYYYKGVPAWGWFYDYHYAPMISDLKNIASFQFNLQLGTPFKPFQQLMGVLPVDSQDHVPQAYRDLMNDETSPIYDFYPRAFDLDMNGKKQDWEAVVKIPFIDEARLLKAMTARDHRLTAEEKRRNEGNERPTSFVYDPENETNYPSSLPGFFPDLVACHAAVSQFILPTLGEGAELKLGLIDGVLLGSSALSGFPSLATLPYQGSLGYQGVHVFNQDSRNQSMVITITKKSDSRNTGEIAKTILGQRAFHDWPYLREGIVVGIADDMFKYELQSNADGSTKIVSKAHQAMDTIKWKKDGDKVDHYYSKRCGVIIGNVDVVVYVRPLKGLKRLDTGALVKDYEGADKEIAQAVQMLVNQVVHEDERFIEKDAPPIAQEFPVGEKVIFLGALAYGGAAQVAGTDGDTLDVALSYFQSDKQETALFKGLVDSRPSGHWYPSHALSRQLGMSGLGLSRITSSLMVAPEKGSQKFNIGLQLKFESKGMKVLGYSRKVDRGWEFSAKAAQLIYSYKQAFPEPFRHFDQRGHDIVTSAELCPSSDNPDEVIKAMRQWIKDHGILDLDPVSLNSEALDKDTVMQIEAMGDRLKERKSMDQLKRAQVKGIPRQAVLKPSHAIYRLIGQKFALGDRVVMVQDAAAGGVPLAMKGVVVGLGMRDIDVVWDVPFMGGETLGGRCSNYRGSTVSFAACLNLTNPQFAVGAKAQPAPLGNAAPFKPQIGPRPAVAPNNYQPSRPGRNPVIMQNPARHGQPSNGNLHFGNAAKGIGAPAAQQQVSHHDRLTSALKGGAPRQHIAKGPHIKPVSPTTRHRQLPKPLSPATTLQDLMPPLPPAPAAASVPMPMPMSMSMPQAQAPQDHYGQGHGHNHGGQGHGYRGRGRGRGGAYTGQQGAPHPVAPQDGAPAPAGNSPYRGGRGGSRGRGGRGRGRGRGGAAGGGNSGDAGSSAPVAGTAQSS